jgi:hypothetical protein
MYSDVFYSVAIGFVGVICSFLVTRPESQWPGTQIAAAVRIWLAILTMKRRGLAYFAGLRACPPSLGACPARSPVPSRPAIVRPPLLIAARLP